MFPRLIKTDTKQLKLGKFSVVILPVFSYVLVKPLPTDLEDLNELVQ